MRRVARAREGGLQQHPQPRHGLCPQQGLQRAPGRRCLGRQRHHLGRAPDRGERRGRHRPIGRNRQRRDRLFRLGGRHRASHDRGLARPGPELVEHSRRGSQRDGGLAGGHQADRVSGRRGGRPDARRLRLPRFDRAHTGRHRGRPQLARRLVPVRGAHLRRRSDLDDRQRRAQRPGAARHHLHRRHQLRLHAQPAGFLRRRRRPAGARAGGLRRWLRRRLRHQAAQQLHGALDDRPPDERTASAGAVRRPGSAGLSAGHGHVRHLRRAAVGRASVVVNARRSWLRDHRLQDLPPHGEHLIYAAGQRRGRREQLRRLHLQSESDAHLQGDGRQRGGRGAGLLRDSAELPGRNHHRRRLRGAGQDDPD